MASRSANIFVFREFLQNRGRNFGHRSGLKKREVKVKVGKEFSYLRNEKFEWRCGIFRSRYSFAAI